MTNQSTVAVLGTGPVGRAVAARLDEIGHRVTIGTRDPEATRTRTDDDGVATYAAWQDDHPGVGLATFAEAAAGADLVVNAAGGDVSLDVLERAGADNLAAKVLLDISNPLDPASGFPPQLFVQGDDSLAERIQRAHPQARVVKALNTMNNQLMADPGQLGETTTTFLSGDDESAKQVVGELLARMGHEDVIDLGDLSTARGPEMWLPLWIRIAVALGTSRFNIKVVR